MEMRFDMIFVKEHKWFRPAIMYCEQCQVNQSNRRAVKQTNVLSINMFSGLRSRWTIEAACMCTNP